MKLSILLYAGMCLAIVGGVERRDPGTKNGKVKLEKAPERSAYGKVKFSDTLGISEEAADGTKTTKSLKRIKSEKLELSLRKAKKNAQIAAYESDDASMLEVCPEEEGKECELYGLIVKEDEDCIISANNEVCEKGPSGKDIDKFDEVLGEAQRKRSRDSTLKQVIAREFNRRRRQVDYFYEELCVLADLAWFEMTTRVYPVGASATELESATLLLIAMMNVVNHMYSTMNDRGWRIEVVLRDYIIATNNAESTWSRPNKRGRIRANQIWKDLPEYIEANMNTANCDSYMALTGNNLQYGGNILGVAYYDSVCKPLRNYQDPIGITEGLFRAAFVFAHELGHQFGVRHTPTDTTAPCSNPKQTMYPYAGTPEQGFYGFSECSKDGFESFIYNTGLSGCLRTDSFNNNTRVNNLCIGFTGLLVGAEEQCEMLTGSSSFRNGYSPADIGEAMCYTYLRCAGNGPVGYELLVQDGTPCATTKICYEGTCQTNVPSSDCPLG